MRKVALIIGIISLVAMGIYLGRGSITVWIFGPTESRVTPGITANDLTDDDTDDTDGDRDIEIVAENLEIPWEVAFLPEGDILVTERPGRLVKIGTNRQVIEIEGVHHTGEGGLLGLALDPAFSQNHFIYLYLTGIDDGRLVNRVERYRLGNSAVTDRQVILDGIAGAAIHDGGRIEFGPDGYLYVTTGDAGSTNTAQDTASLNGKILRIGADGSIPADNPFGNAVFSFGHRNVQGLAWDTTGRLWATEHGPSGAGSGFDEVNLIEPGNNYGWPVIQGDETRDNMHEPVIQSGADDTWAPADAEIVGDRIFFTGLRGAALYSAEIDGQLLKNLRINFSGEWGRLRAVRLDPDGYLYLTTSNRDGRGQPRPGDDKLLRIHPRVFEE